MTKTPLELCTETTTAFKQKANHNKNEALNCFRIVMTATLLTPIFITLGPELWLGKVLPSVLSALAAASTAWLQLRKPQQLWALYRSCQRKLEDQQMRYTYEIEPYAGNTAPDKLLAERVALICMEAHDKWLPIVPNPENMKESTGDANSGS